MAQAKYFGGVEAAQSGQAERMAQASGAWPPFSFDAMAETGVKARLSGAVTGAILPLIYRFSRAFMPVMPLAGLIHVTRDAEVRAVLSRPVDFPVPFGPEMAELGGGATFMLGLDGPEHARLNSIMAGLIRREDADWMAAKSGEFAAALLEGSKGRIDVVQDLIKRVPAEIALRLFGLQCDDVDGFADWTIALSAMLFGDPYGKPAVRAVAVNAAHRLGAVIDDALARAAQRMAQGLLTDDTLLARLVLTQAEHGLTNAEIRAMVTGMITGFVPTNTLAGSNMLEVLARHPHGWAAAVTAAQAGDSDTMRALILEAGRMNPALSPGQFRHCPADTTLTVDGRAVTIKAGSSLLVSTASAMRDKRAWDRPDDFVMGRTQDADLLFGFGPHACIGRHLAEAQLTALFMALFARPDLAPSKAWRDRGVKRVGPFPRHWVMTYASAGAMQSMFLIIAPLTGARDEAEAAMAALGHPAGADIRAALDATGLIHFTSLAVIDGAEDGAFIVMELSTDGPIAGAVAALAREGEALLSPIFAHGGWHEGQDFAAYLTRHVVEVHGKPWGANGLNYKGVAEFSVGQVARQARLADFVGRVLRAYVAGGAGRGDTPMAAMAHVRGVLRGDAALLAEASPEQAALMAEAAREGYDALSLTTDAMRPNLARHREVTAGQGWRRFLTSMDGQFLTVPVLVALIGFALFFWPSTTGGLLLRPLLTFGAAVLATALAAAVVVGLFAARLRFAEMREQPDESRAPLTKLRAIMAQENAPGHAQNHILAVGTMKRGPFRAFTHALALWGIKVLITYWFRPGLILNMGSIHFARWWRLPGTNKVCFYSNFDGSWESYLEDFITRARQGQTAAWSNWQGFPRTKFMVSMGAKDGDAFKQWVRIQQQLVPFWYARFPELSSEHKRMNAIIHTGVGRARTPSEAAEWMRCFGSMPRVANRVEEAEVQALVLRGLKRLPYAAALAVRLPVESAALGQWLALLNGRAVAADAGLAAVLGRHAGASCTLPLALTLAYGDRVLTGGTGTDDAFMARRQAAFLGLSAAGVARFDAAHGLGEEEGVLAEFPYAFRMGMAARARVLGDAGRDAPQHWRWKDGGADGRDTPTEALLMLYADTPEALTVMTRVHRDMLSHFGGVVLHQTDCAPAWDAPELADFEHFGYRDGLSQPVMRGTARSAKDVAARDVLDPGEFILGYKNGQGFLPPTPTVAPDDDGRGTLPIAMPDEGEGGILSRYPDFGDSRLASARRDFGRNGSFLAVRELAQDVEGFEHAVAAAADQLSAAASPDLYRIIGQKPDAEWVKAKLMGRWPDGRPLIGCPVAGAGGSAQDNDFAYGVDDPQGMACPFGAHIRRVNPRDSKAPGDAAEQVIANRHRLLRRGRTYTRADGEKGLFFAALCTDLERQFEFVQQFWANAPAFHGLTNEPDPIIGADPPASDGSGARGRVFTIPTQAGPLQLSDMQSHVQVKGGGYFFLPSRSAVAWLSERALAAS